MYDHFFTEEITGFVIVFCPLNSHVVALKQSEGRLNSSEAALKPLPTSLLSSSFNFRIIRVHSWTVSHRYRHRHRYKSFI